MKLVVDIGNTVLKAALCDGLTLGKTFRYQGENGINYILDLIRTNHPDAVAVCSARELYEGDINQLKKGFPEIVIIDPAHKEIALAENLPQHIAPDIIASIIATRHLFSNKACSIFDFGTIITSTFIDEQGCYKGGTISPGSTTRFRSISRYARNLPLLSETEDTTAVGTTLEGSIRSGVISGIMFEIDGYISMYPDNIVIFTGGDSNYFAKRTKNAIFVISNLVLMGLSWILESK